MRKIWLSSKYLRIALMMCSALCRSWPIGFSTTIRVKCGASGGAIRPAPWSFSTVSIIASGGTER